MTDLTLEDVERRKDALEGLAVGSLDGKSRDQIRRIAREGAEALSIAHAHLQAQEGEVGELIEQGKALPCNCRPSRKPEGIEALNASQHETDCTYRFGREAATTLTAQAAEIERLRKFLSDMIEACHRSIGLAGRIADMESADG